MTVILRSRNKKNVRERKKKNEKCRIMFKRMVSASKIILYVIQCFGAIVLAGLWLLTYGNDDIQLNSFTSSIY